MTLTPTVAEAFAYVRRLPLRERAQLIALIAQDIAADPPSSAAPSDSWDELLRFSDDLATLPPLAQDSAEVLSTMRR